MEYEQIKKIIEEDYNNVAQTKVVKGGRSMRTFYVTFSQALEELHTAVGPFVTSKDQFILYIRNLKHTVPKDVYEAILDYCKNKFKLTL